MKFLLQILRDLRSFNGPIWIFLAVSTLNGFVMSSRALIFNFFILSLGFDREFLGLANSLAPASALLLGIPLGLLMDRIGERRSLMIGLALTSLGMVGQAAATSPVAILSFGFLMGAGNLLFTLSQAPFIVRAAQGELRIKLLSANFGLFMIAGLAGNLFGGQLPLWIEAILSLPLKSVGNYQAVLFTAAGIEMLGVFPLLAMRSAVGQIRAQAGVRNSPLKLLQKSFVQKLVLIEFLVGIGASVLLPYMNLYFAERYQLSEQSIGFILGFSALITGLASFGAPRFLRFYRYRIRAIVINQTISNLFLIFLPFSPVGWIAAIFYWMRDLFMKTGSPFFDSFLMESVDEDERGMMSSVIRFAFTGGSAIGPYLSGWVQNRAGFNPLFIIMLIFYLAANTLLYANFWNFEKNREIPPVLIEGREVG